MHPQFARRTQPKQLKVALASLKGKLLLAECRQAQVDCLKHEYTDLCRELQTQKKLLAASENNLQQSQAYCTELEEALENKYQATVAEVEQNSARQLQQLNELQTSSQLQSKRLAQVKQELARALKQVQLLQEQKGDLAV